MFQRLTYELKCEKLNNRLHLEICLTATAPLVALSAKRKTAQNGAPNADQWNISLLQRKMK